MAGESSEIQCGEYLPRVADGMLTQALQSSGAVQIKGPKWCGKTATAERQSASQVFMQDPDRSATLLALADTKPSLILRGEEPRLIDEWQMAPEKLLNDFETFGLLFDPSSPTHKEKARAAGPGLEKERGRRRYSVMGFCGNRAGLLSFAGN